MKSRFGFAITGGIATGKSSAAKILLELGYTVVDADKIAHTKLNENAAKVVAIFGSEYLNEDGTVNRAGLGKLVFADMIARRRLEALLHPLIRREILAEAQSLEAGERLYFLDIPLYFESGAYDDFPSILIYAPKPVQLQRLIKRDGLAEKVALQRIDAQMDIEEKREKSDFVIENFKTLDILKKNIEQFLEDRPHRIVLK